MVDTGVLSGVLEAHHVFDILYDTHTAAVAAGVCAYRAYIGLGYVVAHSAISHTFAHVYYCLPESCARRLVGAQYMQGEAQGGLASDTRESGELSHSFFQ